MALPRSPRRGSHVRTFWFVLAVASLLVAATYILALYLTNTLRPQRVMLPVLFVMLAVAISILGAWRDRERIVEEEDEERRRLEERLRELREEVERERRQAGALRDRNELQARWLDEMRKEIFEAEQERGVLGSADDVPTMVLRIAMRLLDARKGLLLTAPDDSGEKPEPGTKLELAASEGFDSDPSDSAVVQRFGQEVLEKERIVRDAEGPSVEESRRTPADREIENLVAIPIYLMDRFNGVAVCANSPGGFDEHDEEVLVSLGGHMGVFLRNAKLRGDLRSSYVSTVRVLADAMEAKDGSLGGHGHDVARYAASVADRLGVEPEQRELIVFGSLLHDVGKIGVSERILLKPAPLTLEEFNIVKLHPRIGYRLVQNVPALDRIAPALLHHHERFDGTGYPSGLRGDEIPMEARIVAVADSFSAMTSDRSYRGRLSV